MSESVRQKTRIEQGGDGEGTEYKRGKLSRPSESGWCICCSRYEGPGGRGGMGRCGKGGMGAPVWERTYLVSGLAEWEPATRRGRSHRFTGCDTSGPGCTSAASWVPTCTMPSVQPADDTAPPSTPVMFTRNVLELSMPGALG